MRKRILSIVLALCMVLALMPQMAFAADPATNIPYLDASGVQQTCGSATVVTGDDTTWGDDGNNGWYVVNTNVTIGTEDNPQRVTVSGDVRLILADGCTLTVNGGIQVQDNSTESTPNTNALTIYGQSDPLLNEDGTLAENNRTGVLIANAVTNYDAAIGGNESNEGTSDISGSGGKITINSGVVKATGGTNGAAIGGGGQNRGGDGGTITINGGSVIATSINGVAIGGGYGSGDGGSGGEVTITGGSVIATGNANGAGIGGGYGDGGNGGDGTFSTETNGNAVILASSISDVSGKTNGSWHGVIFEGNSGQIYGEDVTPSESFEIPADKTLTIGSGKSLTIPAGKTLTNNGTIDNSGIIYVDGTLSGTVSGTGAIYYPLILVNATATGDISEYNNKTYGKAGSTITLTPDNPPAGQKFTQWDVSQDTVTVGTDNKFTMPSAAVTVTAKWGAISYPLISQKPTIQAGEGVKVTLSADGKVATITADDGYEIADVVLNGVSLGKVTEVKNLKTGDKLVVTVTKKEAEPAEPTKAETIAALADQQLTARSKLVTMKNGKKAVKIIWYNKNGEMMDFDGVEIYRSTKKNSGYGKKPFYATKGSNSKGYYINTKNVKVGTTYYYRVRGYVIIDGQKYYTDYSFKAIRTVK